MSAILNELTQSPEGLPTRYKYEYKMIPHDETWEHMWSVVGERGGIHLSLWRDSPVRDYACRARYIGGFEIHYRTPPDYMKDEPPSHDHCWLLDAACWHDGSSLQVVEIWGPMFDRDPHNHFAMFRAIAESADGRFGFEGHTSV